MNWFRNDPQAEPLTKAKACCGSSVIRISRSGPMDDVIIRLSGFDRQAASELVPEVIDSCMKSSSFKAPEGRQE
jgi:hypothetical protein